MNADHLARRQSPPPAAATTPHVLRLEPYPNAAIRSLTMADDVLVVALRSGIQLFQSSESAATTASAVWELVERRDDYDLAEAYLCVGLDVGELMQPSSPDVVAAGQGEEEEEELASCFKRFSRYFCVASAGLDSTTHSISVLSTRAHFHVRHELHDRRRVACIHFSMIATKPLQPKEARPFAVSVDVSGCVVVMDVLRGRSVRLTCAPPTFDEVLQHLRAHGFGGRSLREAGREEVEAYLLAALEHNSRDDDEHTFFLPDGVVPTAIRLTCPCWELCNKCNNVFVDANDGGERLMPLTLFISTTCSTTSTVAIRRVHFLWSSTRAVVLESSIIYSGCVPPHAGTGGGAGLALVAFHYAVGVPTTMWAANMGMRMQRYRACDGHAVGSPTKAVLHQSLSSTTPATSSAPSTTENDEKNNFFCRCIPIGRYAVRGHHTLTWMCWVVGTRTGVLMLAGTDGRARMEAGVAHDSKVDGTGSAELEAWLNHDDDDDEDNGSTPTPSTSKDTGEEQFTVLAELYRPPAVVAASTSSAWTEVLLHQGGRSVLVCVGNAKAILRLPLPLLTVAEADLASPTSSHAPPSPSASGVPPTPPQSSSNEASASMEKNASTGWGWSSAATTFARGWRGYLPNTPASPTWDIARPIASALVQFSSPTREAAAPPLPRMSVASNNTSITSLPEPATAVVAAPTTTSTQDTVEVEGAAAPASDVQERDEDDCVERICTKQHVRREIVHGPTRCLPNPDDSLSYLSTVLGSMSATVDPVALSSATSRVEKEDGWVIMQQREVEARRALAYEAQDSLRDMYRIYLSACVEPLQQSAATTMMCANLRSPSASPTTTTTAPPSRLSVPISRAMTRGMRAPRFMHELAMLRGRASAGQRRRWDLLAAVQTSSPAWMQRISDQHEREKCLFELADLRLRQAEELRHAGVAQLVRLFQNQERASTAVHGESAWVAVRGYAYEDESGAVADLERWTRWADGAVEKKWRWMTAEEAEDVDGGGATSVPQQRFLWDRRYREWCVGPWSYAAEWPADADEGGTSAVWWAEDLPSATVRRRAISRRRIELAVEAEHQRLRAKHLAESEALRKELDL